MGFFHGMMEIMILMFLVGYVLHCAVVLRKLICDYIILEMFYLFFSLATHW
ncbi:hypothetical protein Gotur_034959 [Gossypium turneri]